MDFVISKVAMSLCALMVAGVLSGCMDPANFVDADRELDAVVERLCGLVDRAVLSGSKSSIAWQVPCLSDGKEVRLLICSGTVAAEAGDWRSLGQPVTGIHTWRNTGAAMNTTGLRLLDEASGELEARSGDRLLLTTEQVLLDNSPTFLAFVQRVC